MNKKEMESRLGRYIKECDSQDWSVNISDSCSDEGEWNADLGWTSPAGEDFLTTVYFKEVEAFPSAVRACAKEFNPDANVELWLRERGTDGVPETIRELLEDAEAIQESLNDLADALEALDDPELAAALEARAKAEDAVETQEQSYVDLLSALRQQVSSDILPLTESAAHAPDFRHGVSSAPYSPVNT